MAGVPANSAARSGTLGDPGAVDASAQVNQFLGTHGITVLYQGTAIATASGGFSIGQQDPATYWRNLFDSADFDQPFTLSGTVIGRVEIPLLPVGTGADLLVSLCPDSSGNPGSPIVSTRVPAAWITSVAQVAGAAGPDNAVQLVTTSGPLALSQYNAPMMTSVDSAPWANPASSGMGVASNPASTYAGNYFIQLGGFASGTAPPQVANVFTINWQGAGLLASAVPQPSLPTATGYGAAAATSSTVVFAGGMVGNPMTPTATVYTAGWNPNTGVISGWSQQASLPQALYEATAATWSNTVYIVGGFNASPAVLNTVYWASLSNGQLQSWNTSTMPIALANPLVAVVGNYLLVMGGYTTTGFATTTAFNYAPINADGSLGQWATGPAMPLGVGNVGSDILATTTGILVNGGYTGSGYSTTVQSLAFGASGPGEWQSIGYGATSDSAIFSVGAGQWREFSISTSPYSYTYSDVYTTPRISVPLPATGLTNSATYHVVMQQVGGDLNNYLRGPLEGGGPLPGGITYRSRAKGSSTWAAGITGWAIPISLFDQTASGPPWHFWSDSGARHSMLVNTTTPDGTLLGVLEATAQPGPVLNMNPTFTAGTAPWVATGGTVAQSNAHTRGNLPFSAQVTPTGSASTTQIESEQVAVYQGHSYTATAWLYSAVGYSSAVVNLNWYSAAHSLLSTTTGSTTALPAGTWTQITTTGAVPSSTAYATVVTAETGTPPAAAVFWVSAATLQDASGPMLPAVSQVTYAGTWPAVVGPPLGVTQLA